MPATYRPSIGRAHDRQCARKLATGRRPKMNPLCEPIPAASFWAELSRGLSGGDVGGEDADAVAIEIAPRAA
jgi:hypothetical protein